jgi:phage-related baseplate assembly protein
MSNGVNIDYTSPPNLEHVPDIDFAVKDPVVVESEIITDWESAFETLTGIPKTLAPADPVRMHLQNIAHTCDQLRVLIDFAGKENLIKYSHGSYLDNLAALYGPRADRLLAAPATTTLEFTLTATLGFDAIIPLGTQAAAANGITFRTDGTLTIPIGQTTVSGPATCINPGLVGNGYAPGQVSDLVNWNQAFNVTVRNTQETANGADAEADAEYRYRTWLTPESFSTCGPRLAYEYWTLRAHPSIIQAVVYSAPDIAGEVHIYPLLEGGIIPDQAVKNLVYTSCNANDRRPVTDYVSVLDAILYEYNFDMTYWVRESDELLLGQIQPAILQAVDDWVLWTRSRIGRDIIPDECTKRVISAGAKRVSYATPAYTAMAYNQLAVLPVGVSAIVRYGGLEAE